MVLDQSASHAPAAVDEPGLIDRLTAGDETAFALLLDAWSPTMHHLARAYVGDAATAAEVVQETWLAVIEIVAGFEGRSSLKNGVYRILVNAAQRRASRDSRIVPAGVDDFTSDQNPRVPRSRFRPLGALFPGHWAEPPARWPTSGDVAQAAELRHVVANAVRRLPPTQAAIVTLRDIEGFDAAETCAVLGLDTASQLVPLHRAREAIRAAIEEYLDDPVTGASERLESDDGRAHR